MMACAKQKSAWMRFQAHGRAAKRRALAAKQAEKSAEDSSPLDVTVRTDTVQSKTVERP